jgi:pentatricopeptide repeat protein
MSSIFVDPFTSLIDNLALYSNELIAIGLFSIGYYLFKFWNSKNEFNEKKPAKLILQTEVDPSKLLYQYNIYIRDNLSHKLDLNPFEVLHQMQLEGIMPDITSYNTLLDICFERKKYDHAQKLFKEMNDSICPIKPDIISFNTMMKGLSLQIEDLKTNDDLLGIEKIVEELKLTKESLLKHNLIPNDITFNTMIDALVKCNKMKMAFEIFEEMQFTYKIQPDMFTYSSIIKGIKSPESYLAEDNLQKVFNILQQIKENNLAKGDEILFNCVIDACFKFGDYQKAVQIYQDMLENDIKPSAVTYGIMIKGYGQFKSLENAMKIYERMKAENIKLNEITLGCLIDACIKCNHLNKALEIIEQQKAIPMNTIIYTTILKGFTKERNLSKALETFNIMKGSSEMKPNIITYNSLLDCAVQCNEFYKMDEIFKDICENEKKNPECSADLITYSTYIKGLCRCKRIDDAYNMFITLRNSKSYQVDEVLYNSLLDGLIKSHKNEPALNIYNMMQLDQIKPSNVTYSILIKLFSNQGDVEKALSILNEMKQANLKPGLIVYTCLIQTCVKHKRANLIIELYNEMVTSGIKGDAVFYNTLISGLVFNYFLKEACDLTLVTLERGIILNNDVYNNVLKNLCKSIERKYSNGLNKEECEIYLLKICQAMRKNNIDIEMGLYNQVAAILYQEKMSLEGMGGYPMNSYQQNNNQCRNPHPNHPYQSHPNNTYQNRVKKMNTENFSYGQKKYDNEKPSNNFFNRNMKPNKD